MSDTTIVNFTLNNLSGINITATSTSAATAFRNPYKDDLILYNPGPETVYVKTGTSTVVATTSDMPLVAGEKGVYSKGEQTPQVTHIAALSGGADQSFLVVEGEGS